MVGRLKLWEGRRAPWIVSATACAPGGGGFPPRLAGRLTAPGVLSAHRAPVSPTECLDDTYVAALQHDLVEFPADAALVGVVRRPTGWFSATVDENLPALGPPPDLLDEVKGRQEELKARGVCDEEAHNAAWADVDFEERYREHLEADPAARDAVDALVDRLRTGEHIVLVCFENTDAKRCHRTVLRETLAARLQ